MKIKKPIIITISLIIFLSMLFFISNYLIWEKNYKEKFYPGVKINGLNFEGKSVLETEQIINSKIKEIENTGLVFKHETKVITIPTAVGSFDSDLAYSLLTFDVNKTILEAYGSNFQRSFVYYLLLKFKLSDTKEFKISYNLDKEKFINILNNSFPELNINSNNAYFSINTTKQIEFKLQINSERLGAEINYPLVLKNLDDNLNSLKNEQIIIKTQSKYPTVVYDDLLNLFPEAQKIIDRGDLTLQLNASSTEYWEIRPSEIITWISTQKTNNATEFSLDQNKIQEYLKIHVSPQVDKAVIRSRFEIKDGRVSDWQKGKNGQQLDLEETAKQINQNFLDGKNKSDLIIKEIIDESPDNNSLNIKELLGTGQSDFSGSPANRIHNISVGAASLRGILIKPNEEFSLIKALGEINAATGYLQELVIKGDKTTPEFGGGLCQVATTLFRTILPSGLPITMRQNHSYRVSYYEPAGTDATIYDPTPDLRFMNDTGNYILIQTRIEKNKLLFDFWGTKDGRIASTTAPTIYNIVKPAPTKIIETDSLKPGVKKCTEGSHNGADAFFDYTVIYPENSTTTPLHERRFSSHYVPWQGVCLIGKTASSSPVISTDNNSISSSTINTSLNEANKKATGTPDASVSN